MVSLAGRSILMGAGVHAGRLFMPNLDTRHSQEIAGSDDVGSALTGMPLRGGEATPEELELARLIVTALNLDVAAGEINPGAPLYRDGLGLDSIDILELSLALSRAYGIQLRSDDENNLKIFSSLRNLARHIQQHRTRSP